ncbi:HSP90 family protein [Canibacter zhoujuaniae]|uniref:HSP90 family protein n=1 Tax=Canibacter zhoujuaniae TaxID=2708343 RepID=UPI0014244E39|nr:HSP90 family protein [Canibacter zhoujuaniae]
MGLKDSGSERFQVDLSGVVNLLSKNLYSGPQVYLRELLQNAVDALTAAVALNPKTPQLIQLSCNSTAAGNNTLQICDTGVGLTTAQARELLSTIGRSSKRDSELGEGRAEFLGQFGIGMLAAFMVADEIRVLTQSRVTAPDGTLPPPTEWVGRADGTFVVRETDSSTLPEIIRAGGTAVQLVAKSDTLHWLERSTVKELALNYGDLLPLPIELVGEGIINRRYLPWMETYSDQASRTQALMQFGKELFGFKPMHIIDLNVPALGITGVAYVLPQQVAPGSGQHRVYLKRMLLSNRLDNVLPDWAFFVRAVIDTDSLKPTASREQLHEDETLLIAREVLGQQLKDWIRNHVAVEGFYGSEFLQTHHLALRAVAVQDSDMLEVVADTVPYETTDGALTLRQAVASGELLYTTTVPAFRRLSPVARAAGITVVNGGYAYDADLIAKLKSDLQWSVRELESADLTQALTEPSLEREMATGDAIAKARTLLGQVDCDVLLRRFEPESIPAMLLRDADAEFQHELSEVRESTQDLWGGLLDAFIKTGEAKSRTLVLNDSAEVVQTLLAAKHGEVFDAGVVALYSSALALAGEGLSSGESADLSHALETLLQHALSTSQDGNSNG